MTAEALESGSLDALCQELSDYSGLALGEQARATIERRLGERIAELGARSVADYYTRFFCGAQAVTELAVLADLVGTHETYFFRQAPQLEAFRTHALPKLAASYGGDPARPLIFWSAGCATGEEAFTLAMLVRESGLFRAGAVRVVGTDISDRCIALAKHGVFTESSLRALPERYRSYFDATDGRYTVKAEIASMCQFRCGNLLDSASMASLGLSAVVACRNVLLYLSEDARGRVIELLSQQLADDGYLLLGHSEGLLGRAGPLRPETIGGETVFRKATGGSARRSG